MKRKDIAQILLAAIVVILFGVLFAIGMNQDMSTDYSRKEDEITKLEQQIKINKLNKQLENEKK